MDMSWRQLTLSCIDRLSIAVVVILLGGCYVTSPSYNQKFDHRNSTVPVQAQTHYASSSVRVECASSHYGYADDADFVTVTNITPNSEGLLDTKGNKIYSISKAITIPNSCWGSWGSDPSYAAFIRLSQVQPKLFGGGTQRVYFRTFDLPGLGCLGEEIGKKGNVFAGASANCEKTYSDTGNAILRTQILAKDP